MLVHVSTWKVYFRDRDKDWTLRVPQTELRAFLNVLIFNGIPTWSIEREEEAGSSRSRSTAA